MQKDINKARILCYRFFATFFVYELLEKNKDEILEQLDLFIKNPIDEGFTPFLENLKNEIIQNDTKNILQEYTEIFMLPFKQNFSLNISSFGDSDASLGKTLLEVKDFLRKTDIRKNENNFSEKEEHFGFLLLLQSYLIEKDQNLSNENFKKFILPYYASLLKPIKSDEGIKYYQNLAGLLEVFLDIDRDLN